jgi:serine/threonine-protein kinase RsbW
MSIHHELTMAIIALSAQLTSVPQGITFVANCAITAGVPPQRVAAIELALEEALVNICQYAYRNNTGDVEVRCTRDGAQRFLIEVIDAGEPFNILTLPPPEPMADLDQHPVGGLGVLLIRSLVDTIAYRREGSRNILQFVVQLPL